MDLKKEKIKRNIFFILQIIFTIITIINAVLVIFKKLDNAGYAIIPMLGALIFSIFMKETQNKLNKK